MGARASAQQDIKVGQALLQLRERVPLPLGRLGFRQASAELAVLCGQACQLLAHVAMQLSQAGNGIRLPQACTFQTLTFFGSMASLCLTIPGTDLLPAHAVCV